LRLPRIFSRSPRLPALQIYRSTFRPSEVLEKPYAMVGVPILVADTDERAEFLATAPVQMFLNLIRGAPGPMLPPGKNIEWTADERELVVAKFGAAIVDGPQRLEETRRTS
jgi:alkanesulfonate monooxygenase SsuD/methylene tetrahydromethanopterin reductase-like flavin-dependent oxidoreductase (luciferase family)